MTANRIGRRCPVCGKPTVAEYRPFCSRRCTDVDLNRWLSGAYVVAGTEAVSKGKDDDGEAGDERQ